MPATVAAGALSHSRVADAAAHSTTADIRVALAEPATAQPATAPAVATAADAAAAEPEPSSALALAATTVAEPAAALAQPTSALAVKPPASASGAAVATTTLCAVQGRALKQNETERTTVRHVRQDCHVDRRKEMRLSLLAGEKDL